MSTEKGGILKPMGNEQGFLKCGILGFQASGKTFTATEFACGLVKHLNLEKPVGFFDTEGGASFIAKQVKQRTGRDLMGIRSRSFKSLMEATRAAEAECSVLIIDSATHVWRDLCDSYKRKLGRKFLQFQDWGAIKGEWNTFTTLYLNSALHIIICGRAGYEYDYEEMEGGKKELVKTGIKMKVEGEFGFEPSLLLEMERVSLDPPKDTKIVHRAWVLKDRYDILDGQSFDDPKFENILPHVAELSSEHVGVSTASNTEELFTDSGNGSWAREKRSREIYCEKIKAVLIKAGMDGSAAKVKQDRLAALEKAFAVEAITWPEIEQMESGMIQAGYEALATALKQKPQPEKSESAAT